MGVRRVSKAGKIRAAVFDFDGTLVDSFTPRKLAHAEVCTYLINYLRTFGHDPGPERMLLAIQTLEEEMNLQGVYDRDEWWELLVSFIRATPVKKQVFQHATKLYWDTIAECTEVYPGMEKTLSELKQQGIALGIVSDTDGLAGSKRKRIKTAGLADYFDSVVVAGEDTEKPKPATEPFRKVCADLGAEPANSIYVCDNPGTDVPGAQAIGMQTLLVPKKGRKEADPLTEPITAILESTT